MLVLREGDIKLYRGQDQFPSGIELALGGCLPRSLPLTFRFQDLVMGDSVTLRSSRDANGSQHLSASLQSNGTLSIDGQDIGRTQGEYEWALTIQPPEVEKLKTALACGDDVLAALATKFSGDAAAGLETFLNSNGVSYEFWSRLGD
jgi:hypothetical protein